MKASKPPVKQKKEEEFYGTGIAELTAATQRYYNKKVTDWLQAESFFKTEYVEPKWYERLWWRVRNRFQEWRIKLGELIAGQSFDNYD